MFKRLKMDRIIKADVNARNRENSSLSRQSE